MQIIFFFLALTLLTYAHALDPTHHELLKSQEFEENILEKKLFMDSSDYDPSNLTYINNLLGLSSFFGSWFSTGGFLADEFSNTEGFTYMHYESDEEFAFGFEIFDGPYTDKKVLTILYDNRTNNITYQNSNNATLKFDSNLVQYQIGETYGELGSIYECTLSTTVYLLNAQTKQPFSITGNVDADLSTLGVQFFVQGDQCQINFITSILTYENAIFEAQGKQYFIIVLLIGILQCIICYTLEKIVQNKEGYGRRISPWSLLIINAFDLYFLLSTAYFFMSYAPFYELAAIPLAFLSFLFEPKLVWRIFQIHGRRLDDRRRSRLEIQSYFGMLLLFLCLLVSLVVYPNFVYFLAALFLLPQIKHNYSYSQRYRWNFWITFGLGLPKALITVYSKLDPDNISRVSPNRGLVFFFIGLLAFQSILLTIQRRKPRFGLEEKSNYKVYISKRSVKSSQELCAICLEKLKSSNASETQSFLNDPKKAKMMILTPCKHEFHLICLTQWLKSKLECPYCRSELPLLPEDDDDDDDI